MMREPYRGPRGESSERSLSLRLILNRRTDPPLAEPLLWRRWASTLRAATLSSPTVLTFMAGACRRLAYSYVCALLPRPLGPNTSTNHEHEHDRQ